MRDAVYHLFNRSVRLIPAPLLRRLLRTLYLNPGIAARVGYHVFPHVFYNPFPDPSQVDLAKLNLKRDLPGVDLDLPRAMALLEKLVPYAGEVDAFIKARTGDVARWDRTYPPCDSGTLYAMLRHLKPKRFIEIGCGWSSRASAAALRRNEAEGHPCKSAFIEPYPPPYLTELNLPGEFIHKKIEQVPLERFQEFEAGDGRHRPHPRYFYAVLLFSGLTGDRRQHKSRRQQRAIRPGMPLKRWPGLGSHSARAFALAQLSAGDQETGLFRRTPRRILDSKKAVTCDG